MVVYKAYKFRLYPSINQEILINKSIGSSRFVYNYFLNKKQKEYKENNINLSLKEMKHDLVSLKKEYSWLKEVDSMCLTNTLEVLDKSFTNFYEKRSKFPKFKKKGMKNSYTTTCIKGSYKGSNYSNIIVNINNKTIKLPKLGIMKIAGYRKLKEFNFQIMNTTISKQANKYYVSVCVKEEIEEKENNIRYPIGIDLGIKDIITTSDGIKYDKLNTRRVEKKIEYLQRKLSKCERGSKNSIKIKEKIQRTYMKLKNMRKYYVHRITKEIIAKNDIIFTEHLKVKEMIMEKKISKQISNATFSEIIRILKYKAIWQNKKLVEIDTYYPSSQICNRCGYKNVKVKDLGMREWECDNCGSYHDRDINASINILFEGINKYYSEIYV